MAVTPMKDKATGKILKYKVSVVMADGKWATKVFDRTEKRKAQEYERHLLDQRDSGSWQPRKVKTGSPLFADYALPAIDRRKIDENTKERYRNDVRSHLILALGQVRVHALSQDHCQAALDGATNVNTGDPLAPSTTSVLAASLAVVCDQAISDGHLRTNPAHGLDLPDVEETDAVALEPEEFQALLDACGDDEEFADLLIVIAGTGLRQGEALAFGATPVNVRLAARQYKVRQQVIAPAQGQPVLTPKLKSKKSRREIPLTDEVIAAIRRQQMRLASGDAAYWTNDGALWRRGSINRRWKDVLKAAGLSESLGMHTLRHTYASALIAAGVNPLSISKRMGHASIVETFSTYGHLFSWDDEEVVEAVSAFFTRAGAHKQAAARSLPDPVQAGLDTAEIGGVQSR